MTVIEIPKPPPNEKWECQVCHNTDDYEASETYVRCLECKQLYTFKKEDDGDLPNN